MDVRERARAMRLVDGLSARQIGERLGVPQRTVAHWLEGLPVPEWTRRPNAKDAVRERAVRLREAGWSVPDIARELEVSRSTAWLWVRDQPLDPDGERTRAGADRRRDAHAAWARQRKATSAAVRADLIDAGSRQVTAIDDAELLRLGAILYWCEGAKCKPWRGTVAFQFANTDPGLIRLFLRFLDALGVPRGDLVFRVAIHESADAEAAVRWWADRIGVDLGAFRSPTIKRHNPRTNRLNRQERYHGCLSVYVRRGSRYYWLVAGLVRGVVAKVCGDAEGLLGI